MTASYPKHSDKAAIRDAATVIVLRDRMTEPRVLMGQRGARAAFMPNKFVFPGGAVDAGDADIPLARPMPDGCAARLRDDSETDRSHALAAAAIRELWEETGQVLGQPGDWAGAPPEDWHSFAATGHLPDASALQFVFRAITPLLADADALEQWQESHERARWLGAAARLVEATRMDRRTFGMKNTP